MTDERPDDTFQVQALVVSQPVPLSVSRLDEDQIPEGFPEGLVCLGLFADGRLIARFAASAEEVEMIDEMALFAEPRRLVLYGMAYAPGVQGRLMALIPEALVSDATEPWEAASQSYERSTDAADDDTTPDGPLGEVLAGMRQLPVGELVRYDAMRKFPDDLAAELADMLGNALHRGARDIVDHALAAMERQFGEGGDEESPPPPSA
jgi:hypothetical protein